MKNHLKLISPLFLVTIAVSLFAATQAGQKLKEADFYEKLKQDTVQCRLCPRQCVIRSGKRGFCNVRENQQGSLYALSYGRAVAVHIDPIEKKPLFHFLPSQKVFSVATAGCNLRCKFCQNWEISQKSPEEVNYVYSEPEELVKEAVKSGARVIAYTYTEPTIFYEYMLETAQLARENDLKNVMHSSGYINEEPLRRLAKYLDGANIDLKGFSEDYYRDMSEASLAPVLRSLKVLREEGVHLEITTLILPGYNDNEESIRRMCVWIRDNLGSDTPLHFSRFYPMYKLLALIPTPVATLEKARDIALEAGLRYVYIGNVAGHQAENTYCPGCKKILIGRKGYFVSQNHLAGGRCKYCGRAIDGVWE